MQTSTTPSLAPGFDLPCWRSWARRILVGNPFYLFSAACLLYGIYQVSLDSHFAGREFSQLVFNFSALQIYEALLTATSIFLARRRIWYDATLLVVLEAAFILLPFILISQAVYLDKSMAFTILGATLLLAGVKFSGLKRLFPGLNLPPQLLAIGAVTAVANGLLPLTFNAILDSDNALLINNIQEAESGLFSSAYFRCWYLCPTCYRADRLSETLHRKNAACRY